MKYRHLLRLYSTYSLHHSPKQLSNSFKPCRTTLQASSSALSIHRQIARSFSKDSGSNHQKSAKNGKVEETEASKKSEKEEKEEVNSTESENPDDFELPFAYSAWDFMRIPGLRMAIWDIARRDFDSFEDYLCSPAALAFERCLSPGLLFPFRLISKFITYPRLHYRHFQLLSRDQNFDCEQFVAGATYALKQHLIGILVKDEQYLKRTTTDSMFDRYEAVISSFPDSAFFQPGEVSNDSEYIGNIQVWICDIYIQRRRLQIATRVSMYNDISIPIPMVFVSDADFVTSAMSKQDQVTHKVAKAEPQINYDWKIG